MLKVLNFVKVIMKRTVEDDSIVIELRILSIGIDWNYWIPSNYQKPSGCFASIWSSTVFVGVKRSTRKKPSRYHLRCWPRYQHSLISEDEKPERLRCRDEEQGKLMEERYGNGRGALRNEDMRNHANTSSYNDYYCCCHYYFTIINHVREKPMLFRNRSGIGWGVLK